MFGPEEQAKRVFATNTEEQFADLSGVATSKNTPNFDEAAT